MRPIQQVLALYHGAVKTGDAVELKLWCRENQEFFTFSRSLPNKRRKRRQLKLFSQSFSGPLETQQSKVRSQESPWTVVNYQNNPQYQVRFQENTKSLLSSEDGSQSKESSPRTPQPVERSLGSAKSREWSPRTPLPVERSQRSHQSDERSLRTI